MMGLLVFREKLRSFYGKYDMYLVSLFKFALGLTVFYLIDANVGYMEKLKNPMLPVILATVCSFLPFGVISFLAALVLLAHISSVSLEMALILGALLVMVAVLYYGFQPGDSCLLLLTPIFFHCKIPYAIPLLVGLSGGLASVIPVGCGVFLYYMIQYVKLNAGVLTSDASLDMIQRYVQVMKNMVSNHQMLLMAAVCVAGVVVVYIIRILSVDYAWHFAIVAGVLAQLCVIFIGNFVFDVSVPMTELFVGILVSMLLAAVYQFMVFAVDYTSTEYLQFQDDDYYYYVKAVPKITVSAPDVRVQKISAVKKRRGREPAER